MFVWVARQNVGCVFDDARAPWQAFPLEAIQKEALLLDNPVEEEWLVKYSSSPVDPTALPVQSVMFGRCGTTENLNSTDAQKCPSGTLRGRITSNIDAADPVCAIPLASGQGVQCQPPFISSISKGDVPAPAVLADKNVKGVVGIVLGILFGEEQWKSKDEK
eukprot:6199624-Pleurochrysis_carterae.AAC.1